MHDDKPRPTSPDTAHASRKTWILWPLAGSALLITVHVLSGSPVQQQDSPAITATAPSGGLAPTSHPPVPPRLDAMWYAPDAEGPPSQGPLAALARGAAMLDEGGSVAEALALVSQPALAKTPLAGYARYYAGLALQRLNRVAEADAAFAEVAARQLSGQLPESALYRRAEIREAQRDFAGAAAIYDQLLARPPASPQVALVKLGAALSAAGDRARAADLYRRVLRDYTLSAEAAEAERLLDGLNGFVLESPVAVAAELNRAESLYKARRYDQARDAYERVRGKVGEDDRDRIAIRLAQILAARGQHREAREVFRRYVGHRTFAAEAQYGVLSAARALNDHSEANSLTETFVERHPNHPLAEAALNELARRYVLDDEDGKAAAVYTRLVDRFPAGAFAERAAWKAGWWAYRQRNFAETLRVFERAVAAFPRSDYRPSWLYWTARAYEQMGDRASAVARYRLTATDYLNSYYGRLAWQRLEGLKEASVTPGVRRAIAQPPAPPPNLESIKALIAAGLYRAAINEVQYAQKVWGDSAPLQATLGLVHNRMGNLRAGITMMRRAYPQFMAAGGEELPPEILRVIFPLDYWPLLHGNAQANGVDPYVVVALAAQESTFDARIRSSANAVGLMQIIPPTGRRLAQRVGMRNFSVTSLENPEINARLGTRYFADMVKEFGGYHFALAGYNAGEHRVRRWNQEAPGLPQDEWIDNIPYAETQNYVKRILGTAEDYRRLYSDGPIPVLKRKAPTAKPGPAPAAKAPVKKAPAKKAPAKKPPVKKAPAKKAPAKTTR